MIKISSKMFFTKKIIQISVLIMCSLSIIDCAWGIPRYWDLTYTRVSKNVRGNTILVTFKFFDYALDPKDENSYLIWCEFYYSTNGLKYTKFMRAITWNQKKRSRGSSLLMKDKIPLAHLYFTDCCIPANGTKWVDVLMEQLVMVNHSGDEAYASIKWFLNEDFKDVRFIKVIGHWHIVGFSCDQSINQIYEAKPIKSALKAELKTESKQINLNVARIDLNGNNVVRIYKEAGIVNIKGADMGANINVFTISGEKIISSVVNNNVVKIKLPVNKIYIVHIGQTRYKVAL